MNKRIKVLTTAALTVILVFAFAFSASAATGTKSLSAIFRNIKLVVDGNTLQTSEEPFIVGGRTYVPLRVIADALGAYVDWNASTNAVNIKKGSGAADQVAVLQAQIVQKDAKIAELEAKLANSGGSTDEDNDEDLDELEEDIVNDYDELEDVEIDDIRLTGDEDKVTVNIDVDLEDFDDEWEDLSDSQIKTWAKNICDDIQDYYDNDTDISGKIKDIDSDDTLVTFSKDGSNSMSISYKDDDYRGGSSSSGDSDISDVEADLDGNEYTIDGIDFEISDIDYKTSSDVIEVDLVATEEDADEIDEDDLEDGAKDIAADIADTFIDDADADPETVKISLYDEDDTSLGDYEYDVEDDEIDEI